MDTHRPGGDLRSAVAATVLGVAVLVASAPGLARAGGPAAPEAPWSEHLRVMDEALARQDVSTAVRAWRDGYGAALGSRSWQGMVEVGDASLRMGLVDGQRHTSKGRAHEAYLAALSRARQQRDLEGVLRAGEAFAALGDQAVAEQSLRMARQLADGKAPEVRARIEALAARVATR